MNVQWALERIERDLREYHEGRKDAAVKGLETPQLAALLLQKYAYGLLQATTIFLDPDISKEHAVDTHHLGRLADQLVADIDPSWWETQAKRWATHPAGLNF